MTARPRILVVDDRENMLRLLEKVLRNEGEVVTAASGSEAIRILEKSSVAVVLCDLRMPDADGLTVLRASKRLRPEAEFVLMTAYASVPTAVEAMREGAFDYVTKPVEPEVLRGVVLQALGRAHMSGAAAHEVETLPGMYGQSAPMQRLATQVRRIAASDATVLILGETGVGKERVARAIHALSPRSRERFVPVNCAAIPVELLESELFGYARGAFTGAVRDRAGLFEEADGGMLFLDEIAEMRVSLQAKLTRAIEERAVRRLGESSERNVNTRLLVATHRDLEGMVRAGTFREDLWYRLNVAVVRVPPLRDRAEDIELLATRFLGELAAASAGKTAARFSRPAIDALIRYGWPGNVRQLRAAVERAYIEAAGELVGPEHLPSEIAFREAEAGGVDLVDLPWHEAIENGRRAAGRRYLQAVLARFGGRVAEAAEHAGVERESFYRLLRKHGVRPDGGFEEPGE